MSDVRCFSPWYYEKKGSLKAIPLPCGKCPYCKRRRVNSWIFRLMKEEDISESSHFVTLTYANPYLPRTDNNYKTLKKRDFQLFMKRLRKLQLKDYATKNNITIKLASTTLPPIKYYACGEYGSITWRPHYHAIIFNVQDTEYYYQAWKATNPITNQKGTIGKIDIGQVTGASIAYTAKYIDKDRRIPMHQNDDRIPEFSLMSKNLGLNWLTPQVKKHYQNNLNKLYVTHQSHKMALPKYYRDRILSDEQKKQQRKLINQFVEDENKELYTEFAKKYKNSDITFETWLETRKHGISAKFNNIINTRKL